MIILSSSKPESKYFHSFVNVFDVLEYKSEFEQLFKRIVDEKNTENKMTAQMQRALISQLLIMIYRHNQDNITHFDEEKFDIVFKIQKQFENDCKTKYLLTKTNLTIGEIVEMSGFSDNSNFSRSFKKDIGMTPSQFRNKYK